MLSNKFLLVNSKISKEEFAKHASVSYNSRCESAISFDNFPISAFANKQINQNGERKKGGKWGKTRDKLN